MNDSTLAPSRATTEDLASPTAGPAATAEKRHAPWIELVRSGAARIADLIEPALDDDAFDRADTVLYLIGRSDDAILWDEGIFIGALLRSAAAGLAACDMSKDTAAALRPATVAMLEELAAAINAYDLSGDLGRLNSFAAWAPDAAAPTPAPSDEQADAFLSIARHASDIETLIEMSQDYQLQDNRRDAAVTAAAGLAQLIGAITCVARGGQHVSQVNMHAWLMRGAA